MKITVFAICLVTLFVGCVPTTTNTLINEREFDAKLLKAMKTWEGSHISQIIQRFGPPTQKVSDEAGGTIYIWRTDPKSLPYLSSPDYIEPPRQQSSPRNTSQALVQATSKMLYHQRVEKQKQHYYEMNRSRQRMLAMKRMFYVRSSGVIYLAKLMYQ